MKRIQGNWNNWNTLVHFLSEKLMKYLNHDYYRIIRKLELFSLLNVYQFINTINTKSQRNWNTFLLKKRIKTKKMDFSSEVLLNPCIIMDRTLWCDIFKNMEVL